MKVSKTQIAIYMATLIILTATIASAQPPQTIHTFVALCDNKSQGIVPVPPRLGNGDDPGNNLYWGAMYGLKTFFKKSRSWRLLATIPNPEKAVLERLVFKHKTENIFMIADAYKGNKIKQAVSDFLKCASGDKKEVLSFKSGAERFAIPAKGSASLIVYVGHNGLMDSTLPSFPKKKDKIQRQTIILACKSKGYFSIPLKIAGATPLILTTGFMAPEAYTLESALTGWVAKERPKKIRLRAAKAYHKYQKCGLKAAKRLFDLKP